MQHFARPESGWKICALLGDRGEPGFHHELEDARDRGVNVRIVPSLGRSIRPYRDFSAYRSIKSSLREWKPDLVHTHSAKAGFLGRLAARACGVPRIIHTPHVFPFQWASGAKSHFYFMLERFAARRCDAIVCVGRQQYDQALRKSLSKTDRFHVIRNGVSVPETISPEKRTELRTQLRLGPNSTVVGMIARLAPQKGVGMFLDCAARVIKANPQAVFLLIGNGPEEAQANERIKALGLGDRLRLLGHRDDAENLYGAFDVLALSSLYEGLPYVLLEGMACGLPVVATDVLGTSELVEDGRSGRLVPAGDAERMAACLLELIASPETRERLGHAGRERVRSEFTLETFLTEHERLYAGK
jgi:glycosyltransferase involved in cell wall biosynthesis